MATECTKLRVLLKWIVKTPVSYSFSSDLGLAQGCKASPVSCRYFSPYFVHKTLSKIYNFILDRIDNSILDGISCRSLYQSVIILIIQ